MNKRQLVARELDRIPEDDLDRVLDFLHALRESHADRLAPALAAETALAKDWLTAEEDEAWANL